MAPRFAMYNMFLGLRAATESDIDCASAALLSTKSAATSWLETHEDADLGSDVKLVDEYLANLEAAGATATDDSGLSACAVGSDPYGPPTYGDGPPGGVAREPMACAAGGNGAGWMALLAVGGLAVARRRRR